MKKKIPYPGGLLLLAAAFIILILVTFALLSFTGARQDLSSAQLTAARTVQYYEADLAARNRLSGIEQSLCEIYASLPDCESHTYFEACRKIFPNMQDKKLTFSEKAGESQVLQVTLLLQFPQNGTDTLYTIAQWQLLSSESWNDDSSLPVFGHSD